MTGLLVAGHEGEQLARGRPARGGGARGRRRPTTRRCRSTSAVVDATQPAGQQGGEDQADGHRLAVAEVEPVPAVEGAGLQGVGQGVAVVENHATVALALVGRHHLGLDGRRTGPPDRAGADREARLRRHRSGVAQEGVLGHLPPPRRPLPGGQGGQHLGVAEDGLRLPERTDQVLPLGQVDAGLPPDGRVHLGQQGGGHVDVGHAPMERGGGEAGQVGHHAAAHGHHHVRPAEPGPGEPAAEQSPPAPATWPPPRRGPRTRWAGSPGSTSHADAGLGDDDRPAGLGDGGGHGGGQLVTGAGADHHVVAPLAEGHGDRPSSVPTGGRYPGPRTGAAASTRSTTCRALTAGRRPPPPPATCS